MTDDEIKDRIKLEIANIAFTSVNDTDALLDQNILDSVGAVDLAVALESAFGFSVPFVDINKQQFHSVETLLAYVLLKLACRLGPIAAGASTVSRFRPYWCW
ncbi:MAG: acyl carrier protein, partial [Flavobacteriales bacterium]|nr:acyl carrier protein [Flavobacteriales bacterium]